MEDEAAALLEAVDAAGYNLATSNIDDDIPGLYVTKPGDRRWILAGAKRRRFVEAFARDPFDLQAACDAVGWTRRTYPENRKRDPRFAAEVDALRGGRLGRPKRDERIATLTERLHETHDALTATFGGVDRPPDIDETEVRSWGGFAGFRKLFFGMDTAWFQNEVVKTLETSEPGSITLILLPPEHGKTSLLEDWVCFKLATMPEFRVVYASERQAHARKVIKRIKNRMHPEGPARDYEQRFGPFVPQTGEDAHPQAWNQDYFDVWRRLASDERDYNMVGLGFGSAVAGTRCDLLVLDDVQSLKSINLTDKLIDEFRQDWLSRPGSHGRTVILGTRVGEGDFYEELIDLELVDHLVKFPAVDYKGRFLWPEHYSPKDYARMERNAGPAAWARNYQQKPTAASERTFTEDDLKTASDSMHRFGHKPAHIEGLHTAIVGHDPGFGVNAFYVGGITPEKLVDLDWRTDTGLTSTAQMGQILRDLCLHWRGQGVRVAHLVMEDKAFQHGLLRDEAILAVQREFGFTISGHQTTGQSKLDDDLGVAAMARSFRVGEIVMPGADDPDTIRARAAMDAELASWRPNKRGAKLRQDLVMARWFAWMRWRAIRHIEQGDRSNVIRMKSVVRHPTPFRSLTLAGAK